MTSCFTNYMDIVIKNYDQNVHKSISDVISLHDDVISTTNTMTLLTLFTEIEYIRNDLKRFINTCGLLIGLNGLVRNSAETMEHNMFAFIALCSMMCQMLHSCNKRYNISKIVLTSVNVYIYILMCIFKLGFGVSIFHIECLSVVNFALLYMLDFFGL